jgi:head-tail adaptor
VPITLLRPRRIHRRRWLPPSAAAGTFTASISATIGAATASVTATHTTPTYTASIAATVGAATSSVSAEHTTPTYTATVSATVGAATAAASAEHTTPTYTATVAASVGAATASASAEHTTPTYTAEVSASIGAATASVSASFTDASGFSASISATVGAATAFITAAFVTETCDIGLVTLDVSNDYLVWDIARDLSLDYKVWDNRECMDYSSRNNTGDVTYADVTGKRRAPTYRELAASNGAYTASDVVWLVPSVLLGVTGKPGDYITDEDGTVYTVLEASHNAFRSFWRFVTRDLVLANDLRDTIDIQRPTIGYDSAGGKLRTFPPLGGSTAYDDLPAKVQKLTDTLAVALGVEGFKADYAVIVGQQVTIEEGDRIKFGSLYLDITGLRNPSRIDELPVLTAVIQPGG